MSTNQPESSSANNNNRYTLIYFDGRGRAEPVRYMLAYLQIPYTDKRLSQSEWKLVRSQMPCLQIPVLEITNADKPADEKSEPVKIGQSVAICRFLGRQHGLCGKDDIENAYLDMIADFMKDITFELSQPRIIPDEVHKAEVFHRVLSESLPGKVRALAKLMRLTLTTTTGQKQEKLKFILGEKPCWVDFFVAGMCEYFNSFIAKDKLNELSPPLQEHLRNVQNLPNVKEWVAKRPNTSF